MTKQVDEAVQHRFLAVVFWYGAMIWAHAETETQAADMAAKQAKKDLRHYLKRGAKVDWVVNLYEVNGRGWSYWEDTGLTFEDGTRIKRLDVLKVKA